VRGLSVAILEPDGKGFHVAERQRFIPHPAAVTHGRACDQPVTLAYCLRAQQQSSSPQPQNYFHGTRLRTQRMNWATEE